MVLFSIFYVLDFVKIVYFNYYSVKTNIVVVIVIVIFLYI